MKNDKVDFYTKSNSFVESKVVDGYDTGDVVKDKQALDTVCYITKHKETVAKRLRFLAEQLLERAEHHDDSKLKPPELDWLIEMDKEPRYAYGSKEYLDKKARWQKFFDHHYKYNRHHPEHFVTGVEGMNLTDICEYLIDISSYYAEMHPEEVFKLINDQMDRFGLDEQLTQILKNTLLEYFAYFGGMKPAAYKVLEEPEKSDSSETTNDDDYSSSKES